MDDYDLDHVVPRYLGGGNEDSNLAVTHRRCNRSAGQALRTIKALPSARVGRWTGRT